MEACPATSRAKQGLPISKGHFRALPSTPLPRASHLAPPTQSQRQKMGTAKHVLILGIDGCPAHLPAPYSLAHDLPTIHALQSRNAYWTDNMRCVFPTDSMPNWTSVFTSTEPHVNGIDSNLHDKTNPMVVSTAGECRFLPHVFQVLRKSQEKAVLGAFYTWKGFNEILRPAECFDEQRHCQKDTATVQATVDHVRNKIKGSTSSLTFVHLDDVDEECHAGGYDSQRWKDALQHTDAGCRKILEAYKEIGLLDTEEMLVIVCSDHGRDETGKYHGYFTNGCLETRLILHSAAFGKTAALGERLKTTPITITDIAPTILYSMGVEAPLQFRGRPILEAWGAETKQVFEAGEDTEAKQGWKGVKKRRLWLENEHNVLGAFHTVVAVLAVESLLVAGWVVVRLAWK